MPGFDRPESDDAQRCPSCGHALEVHDPIALRYCTATRDSDLARTCICTGELALLGVTHQEKSPHA